MKRISRIPSCCSVRAVLRCYPLSLLLMRWVWIVQWWIGDGVMADAMADGRARGADGQICKIERCAAVRLCVRDVKIEC